MFLELVRSAGLPLPSSTCWSRGYLVDGYWPEARLVVELQSYEHHAHRQAFDRDYTKLARLRLAGYEVLRSRTGRCGMTPSGSSMRCGSNSTRGAWDVARP
jgi:hypothetical protein